MKVEGLIFAFVAAALAAFSAIYWYTSHEPTGTTALVLSTGLAFLIAFYLLFTARRIDPRPEDNSTADVADGAGDIGFYSPHSWWPLPTGACVALAVLGVVFAWWLLILAGVLLGVATWGFVFEYYRGEQSHYHG